jgi:hypothetical protein
VIDAPLTDIPAGGVPAIAIDGAGVPEAVNVTVEAWLTATIFEAALVTFGGTVTVSVKDWVTLPWLFVALSVIGYEPASAGFGAPLIVAVPSLWALKPIPGGRLPL